MPLDLEDLVRDFSGANAPGLVVGISHAGIPIYRKGWGLASLEHGVANCPDTRLPIASATKQMTCAVVRRLETLGRLGIDDPVARWLPEHSEWLGEVTLRQLMNHTAGVRCYLDQSLYHGYARLPPGESDRLQARLTTSNFAPGTASLYSNGGYRLLSWVIERAAKLERDTSVPFPSWPLEFSPLVHAVAPVSARAADRPEAAKGAAARADRMVRRVTEVGLTMTTPIEPWRLPMRPSSITPQPAPGSGCFPAYPVPL